MLFLQKLTTCPAKLWRNRKQFILLICFLTSLTVSAAETPVLKVGVSESTPVPMVAEWPIGPGTQEGEHFSAKIVEDVVSSSGELFIPKNSRVIGTVANIESAGHFRQNGKVDIRFEKILFPDNITVLKINADGSIIKDKYATLKTIGLALGETALGAATGAISGFKFGGLIATGYGTGSNVAIGAAAGAGISLVSFLARKGKEVEIYPGLPMTLNIVDMQQQDYVAQKLVIDEDTQPVKAEIIKVNDKKIKVTIENNLEDSIPLGNLRIVDALGYTIKPQLQYTYFGKKNIPPRSLATYNLPFSQTTKKTRYWLVLTDSFNKQEYFRKELI